MRIALFSDVHANLPALRSCLQSIDEQQPDFVYCLGDLVGYNIWPNEVVNIIRERKIPTIAGNYDEGVGNRSDDCGCVYKTPEEDAMGKISISFTNEITGDKERNYLKSLPSHIRIIFKAGGANKNLLLVHGSPRKINEYLFEDREEKSFTRILTQADADILCFGHTHKPFHRVLEDKEGSRTLHAINTGSVGKPKDGDPRGCYVILNIDQNSEWKKESVKVEFIRFDYNIEEAATAVEKSILPSFYAEALRKGI